MSSSPDCSRSMGLETVLRGLKVCKHRDRGTTKYNRHTVSAQESCYVYDKYTSNTSSFKVTYVGDGVGGVGASSISESFLFILVSTV